MPRNRVVQLLAVSVAMTSLLAACGAGEEVGASGSLASTAAEARAGAAAVNAVMPPTANAFGKSRTAWAQDWWRWAFSMPVDANPLLDTASCATGQAGKVWFLGGSFSGEPVTRTCTVPKGTAIFFPIVNNECSTAEGFGTTAAELTACALIEIEDLFLEVDGVPVGGLERYELVSPLFTFGPLPEDNVLDVLFEAPAAAAGTVSPAVTYGVYVMLHPLPPGVHTIHFGGTVPAFNFSVDVGYTVTVE